jgi:transcription antitermination factor NusG
VFIVWALKARPHRLVPWLGAKDFSRTAGAEWGEWQMNNPAGEMFWYALHVRTRFEKAVARNLRGKGFEEFLPLYRRANRWSDRIKQIDLPLFPGYVFSRFDPVKRLPILTIPGVKAVVGFGKNIIPVEESELNAIRAVLKSGTYCEPWPFLQVGQRVRVEYGALAGTEGIVLMFKNTYRLVISITMLQRAVAVEIDRDCLTPLPVGPIKPREQTILPESAVRDRTG